MEDKELLDLLYSIMNDRGVWFVTEIDRAFGNKICYKLNKYGKLDNENEIKGVLEDIRSFIGDGASNEEEAVGCWLCSAMDNGIINYTDCLHMRFEDEPIIDGLTATYVDLDKNAGPGKATKVPVHENLTKYEEEEEVIEEPETNTEDEAMSDRTQELYNKLTDAGLKVEVRVDNGENEISVIINNEDGRVIVPVRDDNRLVPVTSGSIELDNDSLRLLNQIKEIVKGE